MNIRKITKLSISVLIIIFGVLLLVLSNTSNIPCAYAMEPLDISIVQTDTVYYMGANYLANNKFANLSGGENFENSLYDAINIKVNGVVVNIPSQDLTFENLTEIKQPKTYNTTINIKYNSNIYTKNLSITITKAKLYVGVKINGEINLVIDEGEPYYSQITYQGFVGNDSIDDLEIPAIIVLEPKRPITDYAIVASGAKSNLYEFIYVKANITIISKPLNQIIFKEGEKESIVLKGEFSPYCELEFLNIGISPSNALYLNIKKDLEKFYANSGIYDDYKESESYSINLLVDGIKESASAEIRLNLPQRSANKEKYLVVALYNDGLYEVISGVEKNGYLTFQAAEMGNFVVFTPVEGIKTTVLIVIAIGLVGGFVLVIVLVSIFRRKY